MLGEITDHAMDDLGFSYVTPKKLKHGIDPVFVWLIIRWHR